MTTEFVSTVGAYKAPTTVKLLPLIVQATVPPVVKPIWFVVGLYMPVSRSALQVKEGVVALSASIPWKPPPVVDVALNVEAFVIPSKVAPLLK